MLQVEELTVRYGAFVAVDRLSLQAAEGEIVALLGPNGAGKTSTVSAIVGLQPPTSGTVRICGVDTTAEPSRAKRLLAYVPEVANLYQALTPDEFLALKGRLFGVTEAEIADAIPELLDGFGLLERRHDAMYEFSKGMTQKVALAAALLTRPRVMVLDEPLSGLDVETTLIVKEVLRTFAERGGTVLYCSHLLDVVETLAHRVAVLERGRLRALGTMAELRAAGGTDDARLEQLFQQLTTTADPATRARQLLDWQS